MKKTAVIVVGVGDTMLSNTSHRKLKNNQEIIAKINTALEHIKKSPKAHGVVDANYSSDTKDHVNVFESFKKTQVVKLNLNSTTLLHKNNEIVILDVDGEELRFNGDQLDFLLRPSEYDLVILGIDLHGMVAESIRELLAKGYKVSLLKDALSSYPKAMEEIRKLYSEDNFQFCSYRAIN